MQAGRQSIRYASGMFASLGAQKGDRLDGIEGGEVDKLHIPVSLGLRETTLTHQQQVPPPGMQLCQAFYCIQSESVRIVDDQQQILARQPGHNRIRPGIDIV